MDSVMDISVFGVSVTLFKYLCISVLNCVVCVNRGKRLRVYTIVVFSFIRTFAP